MVSLIVIDVLVLSRNQTPCGGLSGMHSLSIVVFMGASEHMIYSEEAATQCVPFDPPMLWTINEAIEKGQDLYQ